MASSTVKEKLLKYGRKKQREKGSDKGERCPSSPTPSTPSQLNTPKIQSHSTSPVSEHMQFLGDIGYKP